MSHPTGSLTRKSKKDDVEALLSDFDNLDTASSSPSSTLSKGRRAGGGVVGGTAGGGGAPPGTSSQLTGQVKRKTGLTSSSSATPVGGNATAAATAAASGDPSGAKDDTAQSLLNDLDDLVKQRRAPTPKRTLSGSIIHNAPSPGPNARANSSLGGDATPSSPPTGAHTPVHLASQDTPVGEGGVESSLASKSAATAAPSQAAAPSSETASSSSWGGWWSSAAKLADQARAEVEKRAAQLQEQVAETKAAAAAAANRVDGIDAGPLGNLNLDARGSGGGASEGAGGVAGAGAAAAAAVPWQLAQNVNTFLKSHGGDLGKIRSDLGKVGMKRWNEILNVVVPPIESHEVLSIMLSHDMIGFEGVPDVVFQVLQRVMEAHASSHNAEQQLIVNKAPNRRTSVEAKSAAEETDASGIPDMRPVVGLPEAWKLAESRLEELVIAHAADNASTTGKEPQSSTSAALPITTRPLFVRIQPVLDVLPGLPTKGATLTADGATHLYLAILLRDPSNNLSHRTISQPLLKPYAHMPFDTNPWAEDLLSESLQGALGSVGVEYVRSRMQAQSEALAAAAAAAPASEPDNGDADQQQQQPGEAATATVPT